jgi:hypothetical protein
LERPSTLAFGSARAGSTDTPEKGDSDMSTARPAPSHLSLTCRTADVVHFLPLSLEVYRIRGPVTDLVDPHDSPLDSGPLRRRIAQAGHPFYGYATIGHPFHPAAPLPVVFAAQAGAYEEAHAQADLRPLTRLSTDGFPLAPDLILGRAYSRRLAAALAALPDPSPWVPAMYPLEALGCEGCGGRGWHMSRHQETGITYVAHCQACRQFSSDEVAGMVAFGPIERGWPE